MVETLTQAEQAAFAASFFATFPASARNQLLAEAVRAEIPAGTVWYREANEPQLVSLVVSGILRLYLAAPDGRQLTVRYARSGDALGIATSVGGPGILTEQAVTDCALLVFRRATLEQVAEALTRWHDRGIKEVLAMRAYSLDLRTHLIQAVDSGISKAEAVRVFGVSSRTLNRYLQQRSETGALTPKPIPGRPR